MSITKAILMTLSLYVISFFCHVGIQWFLSNSFLPEQKIYNYQNLSLIFLDIFCYFLVLYIFWKSKLTINSFFEFKYYNPTVFLTLPIIAVGLLLFNKPFFDIVNNLNMDTVPKITIAKNFHIDLAQIYSIISVVLVGPILEEIFFRKFLLEELLKKNSYTKSLLISSLCFSLVHIVAYANLIPTFITGMVLGYVFIKTKKLIFTILIHCSINLIILIIALFGEFYDKIFVNFRFTALYWILSLFGATLIFLALKYIRLAKKSETYHQ